MLMSEGGWGEAYFLTTSPEKLKVCRAIAACSEESMFISNYPRNCECVELLPKENEVISQVKRYKGAVFYLPTFRKDYSAYMHPLTDAGVKQFLIDSDFLWIEKPHSASTFQFQDTGIKNVLFLDSDFDVNVLYPFVSAVVSDYSSAVFDAVYRHIPVVMYAPDLEQFKGGNIGLTFDVETNCKAVIVRDLSEVVPVLSEVANGSYFSKSEREAFYSKYRREFWSDSIASYEKIWADIKQKAKIK